MRRILQILSIILLLASCLLLYTMSVCFDRARSADILLAKKLDSLFSRHNSRQYNMQQIIYSCDGNTDFANAEYFSPAAVDGGDLTAVFSSNPPGLNPLTANEASAQSIFSLCSMSLAERDWEQPEKFRPLLAERFEVFDHGKSYYIKLRKGVMWQSFTDPETGIFHPAKEVTAHDIKFTVDTILNPDVNCMAIRSYYLDIKDVKIINNHELIIEWQKEYYGSMASTLELFPLPRHFYAPDGNFDGKKFNSSHLRNRMIISCGPYIFQEWKNSRYIQLEKNPDYIGAKFGAAPPLNTRKFRIIEVPHTQFQSLLAGHVGILSLSAEQWVKDTANPKFTAGNFKKIRYPGSAYFYIGYNQQLHCFKDAKTRQALTMLINREEILTQIMYGFGTIAKGPFPPASAYSDPELKPWPHDPAKAAQLLREAGWRDSDGDGILDRDGKKFTFTMMQIAGNSTQMRMLPMIQNYFAAAGIEMKLESVEWSVLIERLKKRDFEACNLGWTGSIDPDPYQIFHSSQADGNGDNFISFKNNQLDEAIIALRQEFDMEKRIRIARKIEKILHDEQPYTFMFYPDNLVAVSPEYKNIRIFPHGIKPLSFFMTPEAVK